MNTGLWNNGFRARRPSKRTRACLVEWRIFDASGRPGMTTF